MTAQNGKLAKWALVAEIGGGFAVVVTLALVAFELSQSTKQALLNTRALEAAAFQQLVTNIYEINTLVASDPNLAKLIVSARPGFDVLSVEDQLRTSMLYIGVLRHGDMAFFHYENGTIDEAQLESVLGVVRGMFQNTEAGRQVMRNFYDAGYFHDSYLNFLKEYLGEDL